MKQRILFVDDEPHVLASLRRLLQRYNDDWELEFFEDPVAAWDLLRAEPFDAVVLDVRMPVLNGLELLQYLQADARTRDIPVIILTGEADRVMKRQALELGASDLLAKPLDPEELNARLNSALRLKSYQDQLRHQNERLTKEVHERTRQLSDSRLDIVWRLAKASEYRDEETGNHVVRVGAYSRAIAERLGLERDFIDMLFITAPLHDIGKIGIPDRILLKPGKLSTEEWEVMKQHCAIGAKILSEESKAMANYLRLRGRGEEERRRHQPDSFLSLACSIAMTHHEHWDGKGYPCALAREDIPIEGRIVAISDVFDALVSERPYKTAFSEEKALAILEESAGRHFDPAVHRAFVACLDEIRAVRREYSDPAAARPAPTE